MSFRLPSVIVYQQLLSTTVSPSTPYMDLCVVGPVYQCENAVSMKAYSINTTEVDEETGNQIYKKAYPNILVGAQVDLESVYLTLTDVNVKVWPSNEAHKNIVEVDNTGATTIIRSKKNATGTEALEDEDAGIRAENSLKSISGDVFDLIWTDPDTNEQVLKSGALLKIEDGTAEDTRKKYILKKNITVPTGVTVYATVRRAVSGTFIAYPGETSETSVRGFTCDEDYLTIAVGGLKVASSEDNGGHTIVATCAVASSYRALRTDCANDFITISTYAQALAKFGNPSIDNPMSIAAQIISSAVGDITYKVLPISTDDLTGYNLAIDRLSNEEDIYVIEPLSTEKQVIDAFISHCKAMSEAEKSKWRVIYGNMPLPATKTLIQYNKGKLVTAGADTQNASTSKVPRDSDTGVSTAICYIRDEDSNVGGFITNGVRPTDYLEVGITNESTGEYTVKYYLMVKEVLTDSACICYSQKWYFDGSSFSMVELGDTFEGVIGSRSSASLPTYKQGDIAWSSSDTFPAGYALFCTKGGTVGSTEPTWPTTPQDPNKITDGTVEWALITKPSKVGTVEAEAGRYQKFGTFALTEADEDSDIADYLDLTNCTYQVKRPLTDTGELADAIAGVAESYNTKRFRYVQPDQIMITVNGTSYSVGGEYLCVALGAMRAGFPPHQGFSTMGISGIDEIVGSNKQFSEDQLTDMASRGVFWVAQNGTSELPYVLYQTTTDTDQLEVAEDSCVAVVDYASKYYKKNLKAVLGRYNVNTISMNYVKTVINACSNDMTGTQYEYIGPILTSATLVSLTKEADKIKPTIKIEIPYPVNGVDITLQV